MPIVSVKQEAQRPVQTVQTENPWNKQRAAIQATTKPEPSYAEKMLQHSQPETKSDISEETKPAPAEPKAVTLSPQLTALARKEAKFRQQEQAFKAREAEFQTKQAEAAKLLEIKEKLAKKDLSALDELGVTYEEYTNFKLNQAENEKPEVIAIKNLEQKLATLEEQQKANVNKQYEATVSQYRNEIKKLVATNPEFTTVKELKAEEHVLQHILDTFEEDGEVLDVAQASKEIEDFLVEDALAMTKLSKVRAKIAPPQEKKQTLPPPKQATKTLTNSVAPTASETKFTGKQMQHLSPKERLLMAVQRAQKQG
jgi:hypothetical protein